MQLQKECAFTLLGIECSQICWKTRIQRLRGEKHEPYITGWKTYYFAKRNLRTAGLEKEYGVDWRGWLCVLETRFFILGEGKLGNTCSQGQGLGSNRKISIIHFQIDTISNLCHFLLLKENCVNDSLCSVGPTSAGRNLA